jgi:plasmid stability protein
VKNVTIALDDEVHRRARIRAAELGTSLSALVKTFLNGLAAGEAPSGVREMQTEFTEEPAAAKAKLPLRVLGQMAGEIWCADDCWEWTDAERAALEGENPNDPLNW